MLENSCNFEPTLLITDFCGFSAHQQWIASSFLLLLLLLECNFSICIALAAFLLSDRGRLHAGINQPISLKHKHTLLISGIHTWLLPWLCESADVYPSRPECLTKILSGMMIHFALNSQDVCVCVCVRRLRSCMCVSEFRLFEFMFVQPLEGNKHMKVQHNVFLDKLKHQ